MTTICVTISLVFLLLGFGYLCEPNRDLVLSAWALATGLTFAVFAVAAKLSEIHERLGDMERRDRRRWNIEAEQREAQGRKRWWQK